MDKKNSNYNINNDLYSLLEDEPFFAALSRNINKAPSKAVPLAAVQFDKNSHNFCLLYNQEYFDSISRATRKLVIKHEYYHIFLDHLTSRFTNKFNMKIWNIATDLAINSFFQNSSDRPQNILYPGEGDFVDYPKMLSSEEYLALLQKDKRFQQQGNGEGKEGSGKGEDGQGNGKGGPGDQPGQGGGNGQAQKNAEAAHKFWGDMTEEEKQFAREKLRNIVRKAMNECSGQWGSISSPIQKQIMEFVNGEIDWRALLRYFVRNSIKADKYSSVRKINKRYPYIHSGKNSRRYANIAISIDQSGSVGNDMLAKFYGELNNLSKLVTFTVIPFDDEVFEKEIYVWKKGEKKAATRVLCGGTSFDAPTKYVNDHNFDAHIVLTDLCAPKPVPSKCKRLWITDEQNKNHPYFQTNEMIIAIK